MSYYIGKCVKCDQAVDENTGICCQCGWSFEQDMKDNPQNYTTTGGKPLVPAEVRDIVKQRDRLIETSIACFKKWNGDSLPTAFLDLAILLDELYLEGVGPARKWSMGGKKVI